MNKKNKKGIIYILTNEYMPGLVKIGKTDDLSERVKSLSGTNVPVAFEVHYAREVKDASSIEAKIFEAFGDFRVNSRREFFEVSPERVVAALSMAEGKEVTASASVDDEGGIVRKRKKGRFSFSMVNIAPGAILEFTRTLADAEGVEKKITAIVKDRTDIEYNGKVMSLSASASKILVDHFGWAGATTVQGPLYWTYEGKILAELREELEEGEE